MARQVISDLAYPAAVLHLAVFLLPFAEFFTSGNFLRYGAKTLGILLPLYAVAIAGLYALQAHHNEIWRARLEQWLARVPVLGKARRSLALARLCAALEALVNAGVDILPAWQMAADASGSPALRRTIHGWMPDLRSGQKTPAEAVSGSTEFPSLFAGQYHAGEMAGRVDETLRHLHGYYQEEAKRLFHILAAWLPRAFYFGVVLVVAYKVVQFWLGYFDQINNIMK
jgi:type II secretory pathway component PulF